MLHTTPESLLETQPLTDETDTLCLVLDGRVDNREELKAALAANGLTLRTDTDAELILRAYERWGNNSPRYLLGDFAFVIWDGWNRRFFCARDHLGNKPFYYYMDDRVFLCASELTPILAHPTVRREHNEGMIGEYLASEITSQEETLYRGIYRLPPAHSLLVQPGRLWKERYWDIDSTRTIAYKTDQEYADHFRELFKESVRCRLRSQGPVGSYLSGGWDSSSVVGMAHALYRNGAATARGFETFSLVFPGLPCDESAYIQDVVRLWDCPANFVPSGEQDVSYFTYCAKVDQDFPGYPNGAMGNPLRALAREKGVRVLLTGTGGDEWLTGSPFHAADLARQLKFRSLIDLVGFCSGASGAREAVHLALRYGVWPLLPQGLRQGLRQVIGRDGVPLWLNQQFARRIDLPTRMRLEMNWRPYPSAAQADLALTLTNGWWVHSLEIEERASAWYALEERHPFTDRRIVEFATALPEEQRWRRDQPKFILRQAMQGLLPETVRQRLTKAEFSPVLIQTLQALGSRRLFDSLLTASMGWVNGDEVRSMYKKVAQGPVQDHADHIPYLWPLWMVVGIELWLRSVLLSPAACSDAMANDCRAGASAQLIESRA
jgi:asparagine synthase (glutamine-hydrolysing)